MLSTLTRRSRTLTLAALALTLIPGASLLADEKGREEMEKLLKTYREAKAYQASAVVEVKTDMGRIKSTETADYNVSFSRNDSRLLIDRPDLYLTVDDGRMSLKSDQIPGRYAKISAPDPLTFENLIKSASFLRSGIQPDLILMTSVMPTIHIAGKLLEPENFDAVAARETDAKKRPGLSAKVGNETITFWYDPQTYLVSQITRELGEAPDSPGKTTITFDIDVKQFDKELPKEVFAFDSKGLTEADSIEAWITGPARNAGAGNNPNMQQAANVENAAPEIQLDTLDGKKYQLSKDPNKVVVLDFWATWCPPCVAGLPKLQSVADWSAKEKLGVSFYPVNIEEEADEVKAFWSKHKLSMPVLMDTNGKTARAYNANSIPLTVVIVNGKIFKTFVGLSPNMERELKSTIQDALKRAEREAREAAEEKAKADASKV